MSGRYSEHAEVLQLFSRKFAELSELDRENAALFESFAASLTVMAQLLVDATPAAPIAIIH